MREITTDIKVTQCQRLEKLQEGTEKIIKGIKQIGYKNKIRHILQFENLETLYISNYWFEKKYKI